MANKVYYDANEKYVATTVVYANSSNKLFYTSTLTGATAVEVPATDCLNLFLKGVVAYKGGKYYAAKTCTDAGVIDFGFSA